jgi:hypothetical protein
MKPPAMRNLPILAALLLAGCGDGVSSDTTNDPVAQNVAEAAAEGTSAAVAAATDCSNKPDFVPIAEGARVTTCVSDIDGQPGHVSGNIVYLTNMPPAEVLGWSRAQVNASGLAQRLATPDSYSAGEEGKRSVTVRVEPAPEGTRVTINWGREV